MVAGTVVLAPKELRGGGVMRPKLLGITQFSLAVVTATEAPRPKNTNPPGPPLNGVRPPNGARPLVSLPPLACDSA